MVVISSSAAAKSISQAGDYIFRTWPSDAESAQVLFGFMKGRHKNLGLISEQTDFAQGFAQSFEELGKSAGVPVINENYLSEATDFRTMILRLRSKGVDALFINPQAEGGLLNIVRQVRDLDWDVPLYSAYYAGSNAFLYNAGPISEEIAYVDLPDFKAIASADGIGLYDRFSKKYGPPVSWDMVFATSFEAFRAMHQAISSNQDVKDYLYQTEFNGIFGRWRFDKNGDIQGLKFMMKRIQSGKPVVIPLS